MNKFIIYKATNKISGKSYIGKTSNTLARRQRGHHDYSTDKRLSKNSAIFHKALNSYGKDNFEWTILAECDTHDQLNTLEISFIKEHNTIAPNGYNMTHGSGMFGYQLSSATKKDISDKVKALHKDPEYRAKTYPKLKGLPPPNKGKAMSDEQKAKVSAAKKAIYDNPDYINPNVGQKREGDKLRNVQEGHKRRKMPTGEKWTKSHSQQYTPEVREKMRQAKLGKKPANTRSIRCVETGAVFSGLTEIAEKMNLPRQSVWMQIKGKLSHVRGFHFEYV